MRYAWVLCVLAVVQGAVVDHPFPRGYPLDVGIPLAKKLYEVESAIVNGSRIFGGSPSPLGEHPFLVGALVDTTFDPNMPAIATASLISPNRVLFAAHCWTHHGEVFGISITLVLGSQFIFFGGERIVTDRVEVHPDWTYATLYNDIALIYFDGVTLTNLIQPVALPTGDLLNNNFVGAAARALGYGLTENGLHIDQVQHMVDLRVISNEECAAFYSSNLVIDSTICTSGVGGVGICTGDSGGPLVTRVNGQWVQIGVNSFGSNWGCDAGHPSGFGRLTEFVPWISERL